MGFAPVAGDMSALQERELKQQGAIEAAEQNVVDPEDVEKHMVEQSKNAGIPAFKFDPDATPEQKRAQAQAVSHYSLLPKCRSAGPTGRHCRHQQCLAVDVLKLLLAHGTC
jgi:hypothetical protein